jgi:hypothetical protein
LSLDTTVGAAHTIAPSTAECAAFARTV